LIAIENYDMGSSAVKEKRVYLADQDRGRDRILVIQGRVEGRGIIF